MFVKLKIQKVLFIIPHCKETISLFSVEDDDDTDIESVSPPVQNSSHSRHAVNKS